MAVDPGDVRIGLAISDPLGISLTSIGVVKGGKGAEGRIVEVARRESPGGIVVGYPVNMDGSIGREAVKARELAVSLAKALSDTEPGVPGINVYLWDERLTSFEATRILEKADMKPGRNKLEVDIMSAKLILRSFLDAERAGEEMRPIDPASEDEGGA